MASSQHLITLISPRVKAIGSPLGTDESNTSPFEARAPVYYTFATCPLWHWFPVPYESTLIVIPPSSLVSEM
jgi:hypothetical protein